MEFDDDDEWLTAVTQHREDSESEKLPPQWVLRGFFTSSRRQVSRKTQKIVTSVNIHFLE